MRVTESQSGSPCIWPGSHRSHSAATSPLLFWASREAASSSCCLSSPLAAHGPTGPTQSLDPGPIPRRRDQIRRQL